MCNGVGECRKHLNGTMCPSFMATRDERHSTRGRANALRSVLSGKIPTENFGSKGLHDIMDLCLECKACKAECPSNVDMAKLKYEFLDHYNNEHGIPLRSRIFANIRSLSIIGSAIAPVSNWLSDFKPTRYLMDKFLGIDMRRSLPPFAAQTFRDWFDSRPNGVVRETVGQVVLFNDTFMNFNYPSIGIAATQVLENAGFHVSVVDQKCCGRPMISKGMLDAAKQNAEFNVNELHSYVSSGAYVVGCEPSCLLTLRDEYPDLLRTEKADQVANASMLLEEFLQMLVENNRLNLQFRPNEKKVLFHGHCHEKALIGTTPAIKTLKLIPGLEVQEIQAGCCGMAGAFGYEKEHYDISMNIGSQQLFPAISNSEMDTEVVVTGVSCRQQIQHGTDRRPKHIAEILSESLNY